MTAAQQSLADLPTLIQAPAKNELARIQDEINELKPQLRMLSQALLQQETELERLATRKRYLPNDRKLAKLYRTMARSTAESKIKVDELKDAMKQLQARHDKIIEQRRLAEITETAREYAPVFDFSSRGDSEYITHKFDLPIDHIFTAVKLAAAQCQCLQYEYISASLYYHRLIDKAARQSNGDAGTGENDMAVPEIEQQANDRLDEQRKLREYLMMLRIAAERQYRQLADQLPPDSYVPPMLYCTDEVREQQIIARGQARWQEKKSMLQAVAKEEHNHARKEDRVYKPRA